MELTELKNLKIKDIVTLSKEAESLEDKSKAYIELIRGDSMCKNVLRLDKSMTIDSLDFIYEMTMFELEQWYKDKTAEDYLSSEEHEMFYPNLFKWKNNGK